MRRHRHIRTNLYDYIAGDLPEDLRATIDRHLATCPTCSGELDRMRQTLSLIPAPGEPASDERSVEFWSTFADRVERRLDEPAFPAYSRVPALRESFAAVLGMRWRTTTAIATAFAAVAIACVRFRAGTREEPAKPVIPATAKSEVVRTDKTLNQYFRQSQTVLVGLENKQAAPGKPVDIDAERAVSRRLATEARFLKNQPIDSRSARLVGDLERIFIKVANSSPQDNRGDLELIRGGIRQENLLFKVRMAQARYEPGRNE